MRPNISANLDLISTPPSCACKQYVEKIVHLYAFTFRLVYMISTQFFLLMLVWCANSDFWAKKKSPVIGDLRSGRDSNPRPPA